MFEMLRRGLAGALLVVAIFAAPNAMAEPDGFHVLEIGEDMPAFSLPGTDDQIHSSSDYADKPYMMVIFTCNHCPTAQAYEDRIKQMHADYKDQGVALIAISPNDPLSVRLDELGYTDLNDSLPEMKLRAERIGFEFPYLYDGETQSVSLAFGAIATPHVYIFDEERKLRYKGRIDDGEAGNPNVTDARNAMDALIAGNPVPVETTRVFGCSIKWADKRPEAVAAMERWDAEPVEISMITPDELAAIAANDSPKYRLINFWATWCAPCMIELPHFVEINRMYRGRHFEFITVSLDTPEKLPNALNVLKDKKVAARNYLFDGTNDEAYDALDPESMGGAPYTVLIAPNGGGVVWRQHGPIDPQETKTIITDHLGRTYADDPVQN